MDTDREKVYLAALLHDIGKFYQRADRPFDDKLNHLSEQSRKIADLLCPLNEHGRFGYQHTVWTHQFLQDSESILKKIPSLVDNVFDNKLDDSIFQLASFHHKPSSELQALISLADWWSAGIDRRTENLEIESGTANGIAWGMQRYKKIPLYSVFNKIFNANGHSAFGLRALSVDENGFFPQEITSVEVGNNEAKYASLWQAFSQEFQKLPTDTFNGFTESLLSLLKKYTWCIPSNTTDMANVSLYDHLKTTAAFADCLYVYKTEHPTDFTFADNRLSLNDGFKPVILLGGDLSGIQKYIYNIASRKAAVSLKGRSFYLQLLIDSVIQRIISHSDIQASLAHVVYSSGGKFYMILPNTEKVLAAIQQLRKEFEDDLWKNHHGQLILNIDYVPFAYSTKSKEMIFDCGGDGRSIGKLWQTLAEKLTAQKNQKFKTVLISKYDELFDVQNVDERSRVCAVTGIESEKCVAIDPNEKDGKTFVLPSVKEQTKLGNTLKDADFIITYTGDDENKYLSNHSRCHISCVGVHNYLFDQKELIDDGADFRSITSADVCRVKRINQTNFIVTLKGQGCGYGFQFYGGNKQAQNFNEDRNKTFDELANSSYLGVLRMDVDNLGAIFIKGLPEEDKSFSAYSTLSFMLDYFFSGFLNTIRENRDFCDDVNIIYSGGDDVFAVGKWNKLIAFAEAVRENFRSFVGRDDISISGGIAIVGDKFPIAKAAEMAGDAEHAAKAYNNAQKNAFNMFGESVAWTNSEFGYVKNRKDEMVQLCSAPKNMPRSILHKLMTFNDMRKRDEISYVWNTAYFLKRFTADKKQDAIKNFCNSIQKDLFDTARGAENYRLIALAARWAELELRETKTNNNN